MSIPQEYSFTRYLSAKKSVDDRSLNGHVWKEMAWQYDALQMKSRPRIVEVGAGIGTMLERLLERGVLSHAHYTSIDAEAANIEHALERFPQWASDQGYQILSKEQRFQCGKEYQLLFQDHQVEVAFCPQEVYNFISLQSGQLPWDALIAHAFLDLLDIDQALPALFSLLRPGGLFYFTLNFDGLTILEPILDPKLDAQIEQIYHRTMDERIIAGQRSGDSRTGRRLFAALRNNGAELVAAGASDWVVAADSQGYKQDEAYFLHFIVHTMHQALHGHPELDAQYFAEWIAERHAQIERGELVYLAHQLDFLGLVP